MTGVQPPDAVEFATYREAIMRSLNDAPLIALSTYEEALKTAKSPRVRTMLVAIFGVTMEQIEPARSVDAERMLGALPVAYAAARQNDRKRFVTAVVDRLVELAAAGEADTLEQVGETFGTLVVSETVVQQFAGKLAVRLAMKTSHSELLAKHVREKLIDALQTSLRIGAPAIRDAVVEGLGGLLKFHDDPAKRFPHPTQPSRRPRAKLDPDYHRRFERHHLMVLAVAGHEESRDALFKLLNAPLSDVLKPGKDAARVSGIESGLRARADLLRTLTGLCRQAADRNAMTEQAVRYLAEAAAPLDVDDAEPAEVHAAVARFQESVFRTIEVMIQRDADPTNLDGALANAIAFLPRTLAGDSVLCNTQVRSTVAILSAGAALVSRTQDSATERQLASLFRAAGSFGSSWTNPGILEGCYAVLPTLLSSRFRDFWTEPVVQTLFVSLNKPKRASDFLVTHRQLAAHASFRRLLIVLADRLHEQYLFVDRVDDEGKYATGIRAALRALLHAPSAKLVLSVFHARSPGAALGNPTGRGVADMVVAATSFDNLLLERNAELFREWDGLSPRRQLLLTRILALQLQASWRDARELARDRALKYVYEELPTVARSESERRNLLRALLASLPADAAASIDADLQDFVAECGARPEPSQNRTPDRNELPGHVLAMIDSTSSPRIAATVAREIELSLRRARLANPDFEFAKLLYQVILRGPDASIFDHLLPRLDNRTDRELVALFKKHVTRVHRCQPVRPNGEIDFARLRAYLSKLLRVLERVQSPTQVTLNKLHGALRHYIELVDDDTFWDALLEASPRAQDRGIFGELLQILDDIAADTHRDVAGVRAKKEAEQPNHRPALEPLCRDQLVLLRSHVAHYVDLPQHEFSDRKDALERAVRVTGRLEALLTDHPGLQPPEKVLLLALVQRQRDVFARTIAWYCDGPSRCVDPEAFWNWYANEAGSPAHAEVVQQKDPQREFALRTTRPSPTERPPSVKNQHYGFQRYFVDWMSSELDIDRLKWALKELWPWPFRFTYWMMTTWWSITIALLLPCAAAIYLHRRGLHSIEGAGFAAFAFMAISLVLVSLVVFLAIVYRRANAPPGERKQMYVFDVLLPRLSKLVVVPLVLIVDFEHSYSFPMNATNAVLMLLMTLAFLSTHFVAARELVLEPAHSRSTGSRRGRGARVRQIVSIALAQSFVISLIFSIIFGSNHVDHIPVPHKFVELSEEAEMHPAHDGVSRFMNALDIIPDGHTRPRLFGFLPRETQFHVASLAEMWGWKIDERVASHLNFVFYPPLILAWTALGLFFGVFLEGFLKGERLRGHLVSEQS